MNCKVHPNRIAMNTCQICNQSFCEDCLINVEGKYYCKEHIMSIINNNNQNYQSEGRAYHNNNQPNYGGHNSGYHHPHHGGQGYHPGGGYSGNVNNFYYGAHPYYPYKSWIVALLLAIFLGVGGIHRFYVGKIGTGILWLCTGGFFGIGYIVDIICIAIGSFRDVNHQPLV